MLVFTGVLAVLAAVVQRLLGGPPWGRLDGRSAAGRLLSLLVVAATAVEDDWLATMPLPAMLLPALAAFVVGNVVAPRLTDQVLDVVGILLVLRTIDDDLGVGAAVATVVLTLAVFWVMSLLRLGGG